MKTPAFWADRNWRSALLAPASWLYDAASRWSRQRKTPYRAPVPVICVGNLTAGGTGKTPTVIDLLQRLTERGLAVHAVSRGYGGSEAGPLAVVIGKHSAAQVGDEPLLIASYAPTWIARDRAAGVRAAVEAGAQIIVLDDGHQNPSVEKDLTVIVVDAGFGFGNGRVIPAGPLRENIAAGMARADAVVLIGKPQEPWPKVFHGKPVITATLQPRFSGISLEGARVFAFAGIGRPEKFFETVRAQGATIIDSETFPDHHTYSRPIIDRLMARAEAQDLMMVTTEKDAVKLPQYTLGKVWPIPVGLVYDAPEEVENTLSSLLEASQ
jgi:tetraacyldisaccharide 4'-kinase